MFFLLRLVILVKSSRPLVPPSMSFVGLSRDVLFPQGSKCSLRRMLNAERVEANTVKDPDVYKKICDRRIKEVNKQRLMFSHRETQGVTSNLGISSKEYDAVS